MCDLLDQIAELYVRCILAPIACAIGLHVWLPFDGRVPFYGWGRHARCIWCRTVKVKP